MISAIGTEFRVLLFPWTEFGVISAIWKEFGVFWVIGASLRVICSIGSISSSLCLVSHGAIAASIWCLLVLLEFVDGVRNFVHVRSKSAPTTCGSSRLSNMAWVHLDPPASNVEPI